jgi:hypothetical protein
MMLTEMPLYTAGGGGFPWGLLIIGGIIYFLWHKGMIGGPGRFGGPRHGGYGQGGYGNGYPPAPMPPAPGQGQGQGQGQGPAGPGFRGPREYFDEWHRQAHEHEAASAPAEAPSAPQPPQTTTEPPTTGSDASAR